MKIRDIFGMRKVEGDVGVEVEIEGENLPNIVGDREWKAEHDGSLRGEAFEYVFRGPVTVEKAEKRLDKLDKLFKDSNSVIYDTGRAGVHVHVNMQENTPKEVGCFITLYYIFENLLLDYCGEDRVGNLFCLRTCDAEGAIPLIINAFNHPRLLGLGTDDIRYAALNLNALPKYGSVEFRSMRSTGDVQLIKGWVKLLMRMKEYSLGFEDPRKIIEGMSGMTPVEMFNEVFGALGVDLGGISYNELSVYEGVGYAQDFAYGVDWDRYIEDEKLIEEGYMTLKGDV